MKKLVSLETVVAEKEAELNTLRTALTAAQTMGYDLKIVSKGDKVILPAKAAAATKPSATETRGKYQRASTYGKKEFTEMKQHIVEFAAGKPSVNTKDIWKHLRKATRFTAVKKSQVYWQFQALVQDKKMTKIAEGKFALPA